MQGVGRTVGHGHDAGCLYGRRLARLLLELCTGLGQLLDEALDLFCNIRIGEETGEMVTDNYNWISLTWKDGSKSSISLNLRNLEHYIHSEPHIFTLENLGDFWSFASDYLEEDE